MLSRFPKKPTKPLNVNCPLCMLQYVHQIRMLASIDIQKTDAAWNFYSNDGKCIFILKIWIDYVIVYGEGLSLSD
jgi:hypothetical protein